MKLNLKSKLDFLREMLMTVKKDQMKLNLKSKLDSIREKYFTRPMCQTRKVNKTLRQVLNRTI